ncbi:winged helix-turn-helix transcriptional regulator [Ramlibacter sp. AW1]|uniref:Winged helix-turn-helix transcriptional regulator n=1 Tax=Ramlibacter aurantiacus TaxID=2801330 RepID=A0A936ZNE8_9BURK|nr:MarR family winged helix-turn-helix transcriptional regulator [Ramlibacter aurantiacus]MBL0422957.1 winged helix-turn-helix transcriptional regulator [Ramlibacter aurantiacus]
MTREIAAPVIHPRLDGDQYVPALLGVVNNRLVSGASALYLRHFGVGVNEWQVLSVLSNTPASATAHICKTVAMHKTVASRSLRELEAKGLVRIERVDGQRVMSLTDRGQVLHDQIAHVALERERRLLACFDGAEQAQLRELLRRMRTQLDAVDAWTPAIAAQATGPAAKRAGNNTPSRRREAAELP